jgi:tetratricopeptide (TPR) repeat protein
MTLLTRLMVAFLCFETLCAVFYLNSVAWRIEPQIPHEVLSDPLIMRDLMRFADDAGKNVPGGWTRLGNALLGKGFYAHAELAFGEAVRRESPVLPAQFGLAFSLDRMGRLPESSRAYEQVLKLPVSTPDDHLTQSIALYALGRNSLRTENESLALEYFSKNSNFTAAVYQHSKILVRSGRAKEALPMIDETLKTLPYSLEFHYLRFRALQKLGREQEAFEAAAMMERSTSMVSLNYSTEYIMPLDRMAGTNRLLAQLFALAGEDGIHGFDNELREIKAKIGGQPVFALGMIDEYLLQSALMKRDGRQARDIIARLRQQGMENNWILEAEGDLLQLEGNTAGAAHAWQRANRLIPSESLHRKLAGYFGGDQPQRRDFHIGQSSLLQGIATYRKNRLAEAIEPLSRAAELLNGTPEPWFYIGEIHLHLGEKEQAIQAYQQCLNIYPNHLRAAAKLAYLQQI